MEAKRGVLLATKREAPRVSKPKAQLSLSRKEED